MTYAPPAGQPFSYPTQPATPTPKAKNTIGLIALIVAIVAFVFAVIPPTSFIAWLPAVVAIVLAIIGLTRKDQKKGTSIAAIVIAPVAWIIAIIVALTATLFAVGDAIDEAGSAPSVGSSVEEPTQGSDSEPEAPSEAVIGDAVVNDDGVSFTVTGMTCGLASAGEAPFDADASGEFCEVKLSVSNGSSEPISISGGDVKGFIGESSYEADTLTSSFGDDIYLADVNPGLSTEGVLYFDVPAGQQLELVELSTLFGFGDGVIVRVS
ncbi:DUF4352 domain-containing protein [Labedella endophytica]|uniref:DUF4352 domain-containing protein n=1 Tax=Labedella endophytica TaxID=1523160 RepID=A0A433JPS1_9MICO|nr:DUF4352 domain-containing protein [Labedella endophytica]RUQ98186.1 DUF4352 domain-containing protein [Labedella endophytica]